jgi:hypothetical protein
MLRHLFRLTLRCSTILAAAALAVPAFAASGATTATGMICAVIVDNSGKRIEISNVGTAPRILCEFNEFQDQSGVCDEAFSVCVNGTFAVGAQGVTGYNLVPANPSAPAMFDPEDLFDPHLNPSGLCIPFYQTVTIDPKTGKATSVRTNLEPQRDLLGGTLILDPITQAPIYNLDDPDADGITDDDTSLPPGTLVQVAVDNKPAPSSGNCLGVRTSFQFRVGTCKLCKVRKFYNTCKSPQKITQIREFDLPCGCGTFQAGPGTQKFSTAVAFIPRTAERITLQSINNLGITPGLAKGPWVQPSGAGSVAVGTPFLDDFCKCPLVSRFTADKVNSCLPEPTQRYLEVLLSYSPGGVTLKPGMEKLVTFCVSVE